MKQVPQFFENYGVETKTDTSATGRGGKELSAIFETLIEDAAP